MKRLLSLSFVFALAIFMLAQGFKPAEKTEIEWITFEEMVQRNEKEPKKIIIDVYTDWCGWCKKMDASTFQNEEISRYISENYHAVKFDAEQKESITFNGKEFKFIEQGRRGYHELAAALMNGKMSYPTVVFLDENLNMIQPLPGFKGPADMEAILHYFGDNAYKGTQWDEFVKSFQSQL